MWGIWSVRRRAYSSRWRGAGLTIRALAASWNSARPKEVLPATSEGIRLYLASGLIKGVGPEMAGRIVAAFGTETINVLDAAPERLLCIRGVGKKTLERIRASWAEHRGMRDLLLFLQPHGITPAYAVRVYRPTARKRWRSCARTLTAWPWTSTGIGFVTADAAAHKLALPTTAHCGYRRHALHAAKGHGRGQRLFAAARAAGRCLCPTGRGCDLALEALDALEADERIVRETLPVESVAAEQDAPADDSEETGVYLRRYHHCESKTAFYLQRLLRSPKAVRFENPDSLVDTVVAGLDIALAPEQLEAVRAAARSKVMVLTGGPGTGQNHYY